MSPLKHSHRLAMLLLLAGGVPSTQWVTQREAGRFGQEGHGDESVRITVLYDNVQHDPRCATAWGYAALIERGEHIYLFDTGGDGPTLLGNMRELGVHLERIEAVVLSHAHADHTGGFMDLLQAGINPPVYLLPSFPEELKRQVAQTTEVIEVTPGQAVGAGVYVTGEVRGTVPEQAVIVASDSGLVVLTGCAHPGVVTLVARAKDLFTEPVHLVMGGFHLRGKSSEEVRSIITQLQGLQVARVAPSHCTGDAARAAFRIQYGEGFIESGVGKVVSVVGGS
jgi:7,8-dihydropterin-6-yl-methyl-4-(beta-D-ribofuranosyl)aminobenzene 5'-phosphate synthase